MGGCRGSVVRKRSSVFSFGIDGTDWRILRELQRDGRITNVQLAQRVGLSPPPCLRRLQALEKSGAIRGYRAVLNGEALGFDIQLFAMVGLKSQAETELKAFEALLAQWPLVREAYAVSGRGRLHVEMRGPRPAVAAGLRDPS